MRAITTEVFVSLSDPQSVGAGTIYDAEGVTITVVDEAGGPFLMIEGRSELSDSGRTFEHAFALQTVDEVNKFAVICIGLLRQAEKAGA